MAALKNDRHRLYQKSLIINELLPYSESIEEEANRLFEEIKLNLSLAIQKRDLWPGALFWTNRLTRCDTHTHRVMGDNGFHAYMHLSYMLVFVTVACLKL